MNELQWLTPELQGFLFNAGANLAGQLAGTWIDKLLTAGGRKLRSRLSAPPEQEALERAASAAITSAAADWQLAGDDYADLWERFGAWLLEPAVLSEFRVLLMTGKGATLDIELLRDEFEAGGLAVAELGLTDFDALVQDIVGGFYLVASNEPVLQGPLQIGFLRQMAEGMGALKRIGERQVALQGQTVNELQALKQLAKQSVDDNAKQTELLTALVRILNGVSQNWLEMQATFKVVQDALQIAKLDVNIGDNARNVAVGQHIEQHVSAELGQVERLLVEIRDNLGRQQPRLSVDDLRAMEVRYRQSIVEWFETLTFQGMSPSGTPIALPLRKVYVELKAVADVPEAADTYSADERRLLLEAEEDGRYERSELIAHLDAMRLERWRSEARKERKQATKLERRSISEVLNDKTRRGLVILGDPGSGKSTLLHYLALTAAEDGPGGVLPIFVPFAAYDDYRRRTHQDTSLGDFLAIYYDKWRSQVGLGPLFAAALEAGRCLVLLDGMDEVLDTTTRQHVAQQTTAMIQHWQGRGNRFVVTSRVVGYREAMLAGNLPHVTVLDFGRPEIELFALQWCRAYEVWVAGGRETTTALREAAVQEKALLEDVRGNPSVEQLAANPLLLTMLAMLRRQVGKLPDRRIELYDKYLETMMVHWGTGRSPGAHTQKIERFDKHRATAYLIDLALWLQCNRPSGTATRAELERRLVAISLRFKQIEPQQAAPEQQLAAQQDAEAFVRDMRYFAGLLAERGRDAFGFLHLTFQEYFAGRALARLTPEERWTQIAPVLHLPRWREPILLCAGQLGVVEQRREEATELVRRVLNAGSEHEAILHRDLFLAASVAADDVGVAPPLLKETHDRLTPLLRSAVPTLRDMAIVALAHLGRVGCEPAIGTLVATLDDRTLCIGVMRATAFLLGGPELIQLRDELRQRLSDDDSDVRLAAFSALGPLAATDEAIKGELRQRLSDDDNNVRFMAVRALGPLAATDEAIKGELRQRLSDDDNNVRFMAVRALGPLAATDEAIKGELRQRLSDSARDMWLAAVSALGPLAATDEAIKGELRQRLSDSAWDMRREAVRALGPLAATDEAIKGELRQRLSDDDSDVRLAAVWALGPLAATDVKIQGDLRQRLSDDNRVMRLAAVSALGPLAATDEAIKGELRQRLSDSARDMRLAAFSALGPLAATDEAIKGELRQRLSDDDSDVRRKAFSALGPLAATDEVIKGELRQRLSNDTWDVRYMALMALGPLAATDEAIKGALRQRLSDDDIGVRLAAVRALGPLAATDEAIKGELRQRFSDDDRDVQLAAVSALGPLAATDEAIKGDLRQRLSDAAWSVRLAAVRALGPLAASDGAIKGALLERLSDDDSDVRRAAFSALGPLAASDGAIKGALLERLSDDNWGVRLAAVRALEPLAASDGAIKGELRQRLSDDDRDMRLAAVSALGPLAATDEAIKGDLRQRLSDDDRDVRREAVMALGPLAATDEAIKGELRQRLSDSAWDMRLEAVSALGPLAATDEAIKGELRQRLSDDDIFVRREAVSALGLLAATDEAIKGELRQRLSDGDSDVRCEAVSALGLLAATDEAIKGELRQRLSDSARDMRLAAVSALGPLAATDEAIKGELRQRLSDDDSGVRLAAVSALELLAATDVKIQGELRQRLSDDDIGVRLAAVRALELLAATDVKIQGELRQRLSDDAWGVRLAAVRALGPLAAPDVAIRIHLMEWLGMISEDNRQESLATQRVLIDAFAVVVATDFETRAQITALLGVRASSLRHAAAQVLIAMPGGPPLEVMPRLRALLYDMRGEESWTNRLQAAEMFVNDRDRNLSRDATATALEALDYATQPWYNLPNSGPAVREQASMILGRLEPVYRNERVFARLVRVMNEDADADVRDAAYGALLRLAAAPDAPNRGDK